MPVTYKVFAPFSGQSWGRGCYCATLNCDVGNDVDCSPNGQQDDPPCLAGCVCGGFNCSCTHGAGILSNPIDIGPGTDATQIKFYGTSNILSIKTTRIDDFCNPNPPPGFEYINHGVKVDLYCQTGGQSVIIGTVFYGHLQNRIANGTYSTGLWGRVLGDLGPNCACSCSSGIHVHMTRNSGGSTNLLGCYASVTAGSTMIYQWVWPACPL
jgi:hypothetical protein